MNIGPSQDDAALGRIKASLEDARAGRLSRHESVEALMQHLESATDEPDGNHDGRLGPQDPRQKS